MFDQALGIMHGALVTVGVITGPLLVASLVVGLVIGLLQAVTQLSDMTLSFLPKAAVVGAMVWALGPWFMHVLIQFAQNAWTQAGGLHP